MGVIEIVLDLSVAAARMTVSGDLQPQATMPRNVRNEVGIGRTKKISD